jgi:hypothetical protein
MKSVHVSNVIRRLGWTDDTEPLLLVRREYLHRLTSPCQQSAGLNNSLIVVYRDLYILPYCFHELDIAAQLVDFVLKIAEHVGHLLFFEPLDDGGDDFLPVFAFEEH